MYTPISTRDLAFLDTETTGLSANHNEVIEVAIIRCDPNTLAIKSEWCSKIKPQRIETAHPKALAVNGYTKEAWADAPFFEDVAEEIGDRLADAMIVGHNVGFDLDFLNAGIERAGLKIRLPYHKIDTVTLAYEHLVPKGLKKLSLDTIRGFLKLSTDGAHTALVDVQQTRLVYMHMICPHLIPEEVEDEAQISILDLLAGVQ